MKSIQEFELGEKRVLLRCDLNVPFENGKIQDDFRLAQSVPSIQYLVAQGAKCIILAHFGRPTLQETQKFSLFPIAKRLEQLVGKPIRFIDDPLGKQVQDQIGEMRPGKIALLENIRFYKGEEENDPVFAKLLASLGDLYVNDAFGGRKIEDDSNDVYIKPAVNGGIKIRF